MWRFVRPEHGELRVSLSRRAGHSEPLTALAMLPMLPMPIPSLILRNILITVTTIILNPRYLGGTIAIQKKKKKVVILRTPITLGNNSIPLSNNACGLPSHPYLGGTTVTTKMTMKPNVGHRHVSFGDSSRYATPYNLPRTNALGCFPEAQSICTAVHPYSECRWLAKRGWDE